ncbi:MAG: bifunctional alpha,alpha-trehalose-phosphate synthase (UDP-forming)/trehalose-phosphatase [Bacteroidales bacterium]|nr:bifunctional alpha,alpha-trehalose-phosphate synthase (UDP-forming)/trehalose-phosphatase [Bacteroidales bacterium]MBN2762669.1 bifunctional alpha,alpha-trehalose-phosphate synthase (UDP-forming)/trehalose-phosphatase [Bacteroidales bacterium]
MRIIIISNRLPIKAIMKNNRYHFVRSEGGLATGLRSLQSDDEIHWIGWPGLYPEDNNIKKSITEELLEKKFHPVFLSAEHIQDYYEGYSNSTLWPLCHYFYSLINYDKRFWEAYKEVNKIFSDVAAKIIKPDDTVWVQDYQLMLLPALIRKDFPDIAIGYFHHIPFPSYELFRVLPERAEILKGLMGADLIGFHTHDYMRHFLSAAYRVLGLEFHLDEISYESRKVHIDAFPMGINYTKHYNAPKNNSVRKIAQSFRSQFGSHSLVLSVDRLDYTKGIINRLKGFEDFIRNHLEYREKTSLVMVVVPSRDNVESYAELKARIDETIGNINGNYSTLNWQPIYYFYRSFTFEKLIALYHIADIALVSPLRDGMNLVAKEYVAAKRDQPGVLILSEMAGAAIELKEAIIINPNNVEEIENALVEAMEMSTGEKMERLQKMQQVIASQTISKWTADFIKELKLIKEKTKAISSRQIDKKIIKDIKKQYDTTGKRLIILDYDGTLVPLVKDPKMSVPDKNLLKILDKLSHDPKNKVVINSGRNPDILDGWLGHLNVLLAAEHGVFYKEKGKWHKNVSEKPIINKEIMNILKYITGKTPGSHIETKKMSLVWHYRNSDVWLAELRERQLVDALMMPCSRQNLQIMKGNKVVEIKAQGINKGIEVMRLLKKETYDFIIAMGDDVTDEDMFHSLPDYALTIKVGPYSDSAKYNLSSPEESVAFLENLVV